MPALHRQSVRCARPARQSVREPLVAAGNGGYNATDRQALVVQLRAARDRLVELANTRDGAGG